MIWSHIIAEEPVDKMGEDFAREFSGWLSCTTEELDAPRSRMTGGRGWFSASVVDLFRRRYDLAVKHGTYFALQMAGDVWKRRYNGMESYNPCWSFAIPDVPRTVRFWKWAEELRCQNGVLPSDQWRRWDTDFAPHPSLPGAPYESWNRMPTWEFVYRPSFEARKGGAVKMRRLRYGHKVYLFEHVRDIWVPLMRSEAMSWWQQALLNNDASALAAFEWCWFWTNPFGRAGALSGDAMSLVLQKHLGFFMRPSFYHQDQEALLMPFDAYVEKRRVDFLTGFTPAFAMNA